ncbi:CD3324 family protein [Ornithinibacillus contaminans]|uniref:CD3324 family protein n=1 Tax=Ornithinibacillus contaminans TaxID=694055 RepID=UPI00064D7F72|nr:CD3324 family protein [Ornithinibacillus contaminans]
MSYVKAEAILPESLLKEIQKFVEGETIYIPKKKANYLKWGASSGARKSIAERNASIKKAYQDGHSIDDLVAEYFLSPDTIKKILYSK